VSGVGDAGSVVGGAGLSAVKATFADWFPKIELSVIAGTRLTVAANNTCIAILNDNIL